MKNLFLTLTLVASFSLVGCGGVIGRAIILNEIKKEIEKEAREKAAKELEEDVEAELEELEDWEELGE